MSTPQQRQSERRLERIEARAPKTDREPPDWLELARETLRDHPFTALAVAAGVGFALGQGRATRLLIKPLFTAGMRVAVPSMFAPLAAAILQQVKGSSHFEPEPTKEKRS